MRISLNWLSDSVSLPPPDELARRLTMAGLEVEGIEPLHQGLDLVVVGKILESGAHPDAEKLSVTKVDVGLGPPLQIVCGAKNYQVGDLVPVAKVGAKLPGGVEIKQATLRGVESFGMLCSARELGISEEAAGLLILDPGLLVGTSIAGALHLADVAFEVNVTPNRPDALSHLGVAREVATLTGQELRLPKPAVAEAFESASAKANVTIEWPERCPRYMARVIEGVKIGPSPQWIQQRLRAVGVRPINNVVDATNYVLMELGHPLHAFDLDYLAGSQIRVRAAKAGEIMNTLDGKERKLDADDLVIADAERAVALAGVMGGGNSEVTEKTTRLLLESAYFQPAGIRRSARRHGLHTEASHRFERGTDVEALPLALDRAASMIAELAGGKVLAGSIEVHPSPASRRKVTLRFAKLEALLGAPVPNAEATRILAALGFGAETSGPESITVSVPARRPDVEREEDLIEEVARVRGYEQIPAAIPRVAASRPAETKAQAMEKRLRIAAASAGLSEVVNYSFISEKELAAVDPQKALGTPIPLRNPLSAEQGVMRTSLLPGLLQNLSLSLRHQSEDVRLYELGRVYRPGSGIGRTQPAVEEARLAGVLTGHRAGTAWNAPKESIDFYDAKGAVEALLQAIGATAGFEPARGHAALHPRAAAWIMVGQRRLGAVGELHPQVLEKLNLPGGIFAFDLEAHGLTEVSVRVPRYAGLPKFPAVLRDLAVVLDEKTEAETVLRAVREAGGGLVEDVLLFDVYRGAPIPAGRKSLAMAIRYRAADRTLTDTEAIAAHETIVAALSKELGAALRA